jgi:hypothetical protein
MINRTRRVALGLAAALSIASLAHADAADKAKAAEKEIASLPGYVDFAPLERITQEAKVEVNLRNPMLSLVSKMVGHEEPELREMLANLKLVRVRVYELTPYVEQEFISAGSETTTRLDKAGWERVARVRDRDERVDIYFKPSSNAEFIDGVLVIALDDEATFVNIVGTIRPEDVGRISEHFDIGVDSDGDAKIKVESKIKTKKDD